MSDPTGWLTVQNVTVVGVLLFVIILVITGWFVTKGHLQDWKDYAKQGWRRADVAERELAENTKAMARLSDTHAQVRSSLTEIDQSLIRIDRRFDELLQEFRYGKRL